MSLTLTTRPTIVDRFIPRSLAADIALVFAGAVMTSIAAQISVPLPFSPVPITGQTFAVLLVAATLGMSRGSLSMALYVLFGAVGLPVFTGAKALVLGGATMGYLVGFVAAAALVGFLAQRKFDRNVFGVAASFIAGNVVIYSFGAAWLSVFLGSVGAPNDLAATLAAGVAPFLVGDAIKITLAAALLPLAWKGVSKLKG